MTDKRAVYCETLRHARALANWLKSQPLTSDTQIFLINVVPAFAYAEIGEGAASFQRGHSLIENKHRLALNDLAAQLATTPCRVDQVLLAGSRAEELARFCNAQDVSQLVLVKPSNFWLERFMMHQLTKKLAAKTHTSVLLIDC